MLRARIARCLRSGTAHAPIRGRTRKDPLLQGRWRWVIGIPSVAALAAGLLAIPAAPAMAAYLAPTAVGAGAATDNRVWTAVGTAAGSLVRARVYVAGLPGALVDNQRWQWERVASNATAGITFRIRNVASSRCLDQTSAGLVINNCGTAATQRWRAPLTDPNGGWTLINQGNSQCLAANSVDAGAIMKTAACDRSALQRWRLRPASLDCTIRSRDWTMTEVCALQSAERMRGVTSNWRHYPLSMPWVDPEDYVLTHTVKSYVQTRPLTPSGGQGQTGVEFGLQADRSIQPSGTVSYKAYWLEWNTTTEQVHPLSTVIAPRSNTADGRNHTFMMLGNGDAGQWDLLYDFDTVAETTLQAGGTTRLSRTGMAIRYPHAVTAEQSFGFRMQVMNSGEVWRLPYLTETGLAEPKKCDSPPRYEDWGYDTVNLPPNCMTSSYKALSGENATDPAVLDSFGVGKPATAMAEPAGPLPPSLAEAAPATYNGVDQKALATCLETDASQCLSTVPGLAGCVAARLRCNVTAPAGAVTAPPGAALTANQALEEARRIFSVLKPATAKVTTRRGADAKSAAPGTHGGPVHVVTSDALVRSTAASNPAVYRGYRAVFDVQTGRMTYACLGVGCKEAV
ncbi:RICIN domain-containing protein [Actinoplanes sp. NPDC089786]|uniref:RICIN domain-containing protein n=1 Tax=Actinoplanes sp. NPDC089786 TaxID=3155185 RepID=UPI0034430D52